MAPPLPGSLLHCAWRRGSKKRGDAPARRVLFLAASALWKEFRIQGSVVRITEGRETEGFRSFYVECFGHDGCDGGDFAG